jgi:Flp pilus assembly protein TadG
MTRHRARSTSSTGDGSRGQALAEFALVSPIFFLLLFGIIQLGLIFGGQNGLVSATREEARYAAPFHVTTAAEASAVCANKGSAHGLGTQLTTSLSAAIPGYAAANVSTRQVTYSWLANPDGTYYVQLEVHVVYAYPLYVPLVAAVLDRLDGTVDNRFTLDAREQMRIENSGLTTSYSSVTCSI